MSAGAAPLLLGLDAGTTRIRALVFDAAGRVVAEGSAPTPTERPGPGLAQHDAEALWQAAAAALREATRALDGPGRVVGLGVASVGEAGVLLDAEDRPLAPILAWYDPRPAAEHAWLERAVGAQALHALTGLCPDPTFTLCKLLWLKRNLPDALDRARRWLHVADWLAFRLCGVAATDASLASRTMALDLARIAWAEDLLREAGVPAALLPPIRGTGERLGAVTAEAAAATGLPPGCAVAIAGHDHVAGMLGAGADRPGVLLDSMGTAEALTVTLAAPILEPALGRQGYNQGVLRVEQPLFYVFAGLPTSGAALEWFRALHGGVPHAALTAEAEAVPPGSRGVLFLPHLRLGAPPAPDPQARGAFLGLSADAGRGVLYRAVLEGLAYESRHMLEPLLAVPGVPAPQRLVMIGGSTRNRLLMRIKASVLARELTVATMAEATSQGAALLGGLAAGVFPDLATARGAFAVGGELVAPEPAWASAYERRYQAAYRGAYARLRPLTEATLEP